MEPKMCTYEKIINSAIATNGERARGNDYNKHRNGSSQKESVKKEGSTQKRQHNKCNRHMQWKVKVKEQLVAHP